MFAECVSWTVSLKVIADIVFLFLFTHSSCKKHHSNNSSELLIQHVSRVRDDCVTSTSTEFPRVFFCYRPALCEAMNQSVS